MTKHLRIILITALALAGSCLWSGASQAAIAPGCANPVDSALNQYCDDIPTSSGSQSPAVGTPSLATALPKATLSQLVGAGTNAAAPGHDGTARRRQARRRKALLSLPAPTLRTHLSNSRAAISSSTFLPLWLELVLAGLAVAMTVFAGATLYRNRSEE